MSCIDSRASAEIVFDAGLGDLFNARIAANIADADLVGSLEFVCAVSGAKLVLVMGQHERTSKYAPFVEAVSEAKVRQTLDKIRELSPILRDLEKAGKIQIVGSIYDLETGRVRCLPKN